jgi:hypothetical protein
MGGKRQVASSTDARRRRFPAGKLTKYQNTIGTTLSKPLTFIPAMIPQLIPERTRHTRRCSGSWFTRIMKMNAVVMKKAWMMSTYAMAASSMKVWLKSTNSTAMKPYQADLRTRTNSKIA